MKMHSMFMKYRNGLYYVGVYRPKDNSPITMTPEDVHYRLGHRMSYEDIELAMERAKCFRYLPKGIEIRFKF